MWFLLLFTFSIAVEITQLKDYSISGTMAIIDSVNQTKCVAKKGGKKKICKKPNIEWKKPLRFFTSRNTFPIKKYRSELNCLFDHEIEVYYTIFGNIAEINGILNGSAADIIVTSEKRWVLWTEELILILPIELFGFYKMQTIEIAISKHSPKMNRHIFIRLYYLP